MFYYNQNNYNNIKYDNPSTKTAETIETSGCGVCSSCIVFNSLAGKELYTVAQMAEFSIKNKARDNYGTNVKTLLTALCKANPSFAYTTTNDEDKLIKHLKNGGMAIANQGDKYNVFSTAGHFVVADKMVGNNIDIVDPQMYTGKYDAYNRPKRIVKKTANGCVVSKAEIAKATQDRSPAYFLVTYTKPKTTVSTTATPSKTTSAPNIPFKKSDVVTLTTNVNVRTGAGTNYKQKTVSQLTTDGKKHTTSKMPFAKAVLKKGTKVTIQAIKMVGSDIWAQIPSGWICLRYNGKNYAK